MKVQKCVQCGFCCKRCSCGFGEYDQELEKCEHLKIFKSIGTVNKYICEKFEEIKKDSSSIISPAFGAGCCASINTFRYDVLRVFHNNSDKWFEI